MNDTVDTAAPASLSDRLRKLPTAVVSDVLAAMGFHDQVVASSIRTVTGPCAIAGPALCLLGEEAVEQPKGSAAKVVFEMDRRIARGCIAVIASGGHKVGATIGGNVGLSWKLRGCAGVVCDGGIRDVQEFISIALPVFADFVGPMSNKGHWYFTAIDVPVMLPGQTGEPVHVRSGDLIHADTDGVVVVPAAVAERAVADAEIVEQIESRIKSALQLGEDREAVYARHDRFGHIKKIA
jgi:4-hydroxy-4-methyl-2-oxoglutarate aldolase